MGVTYQDQDHRDDTQNTAEPVDLRKFLSESTVNVFEREEKIDDEDSD